MHGLDTIVALNRAAMDRDAMTRAVNRGLTLDVVDVNTYFRAKRTIALFADDMPAARRYQAAANATDDQGFPSEELK